MKIYLHPNQQHIKAKAVLFDLDGTLVRSTGSIESILTNWATEQSLEVYDVLAYCHGKRTIDIVRHFVDAALVEQNYQTLTAQFVQASLDTSAIQGSLKFLECLNQHQIPWAVVSSSERVLIEARLKAAGLPQPKIMISAEDVEKGKPDPTGYLLGAQLLKTDIAECLVFEDAPSGILAAQQAGAQLITLGHPQQPLSHMHIEHYEQLNLKDF